MSDTTIKEQSAAPYAFAIVAARFHDYLTDKLADSARETLLACGADPEKITLVRVPGAFELPLVAKKLASSGNFAAVICLGCLIRGQTSHFDHIAGACAKGIIDVGLQTGVPVTFGVITAETAEQAAERAGDGPRNKGVEAARAAIEMAAIVTTSAK